jgi:hypothetical protein
MQTDVGANAWVLHYNKDIFGDDAAVYKPERWLESKEANNLRDSMMFAVRLIALLGDVQY